jgi:hypothetical protein
VLWYQGKYEAAAEEMNRRALEGYGRVLGKEHLSTLNSVYSLTYLLHQKMKYGMAIALYGQAPGNIG